MTSRGLLPRLGNAFLRFALPLGLVLLWELAIRAEWLDKRFLPSPSAITVIYWEMLRSGELLMHTLASLRRVAIGLSLATVLGVGLGVAMGASRHCRQFLESLVELLRPVPPIALIPLAIFWLGIGNESKIFLIFIACFFPILLNTLNGVLGADPSLVNVHRTMGATRAQTLWKVLLPSALPQIFTGFRISVGIALIVLVAAEMVAAFDGLGYLILFAERTWQLEAMFVGIITISVIGLVLNQIFLTVGYRFLHWYYRGSVDH